MSDGYHERRERSDMGTLSDAKSQNVKGPDPVALPIADDHRHAAALRALREQVHIADLVSEQGVNGEVRDQYAARAASLRATYRELLEGPEQLRLVERKLEAARVFLPGLQYSPLLRRHICVICFAEQRAEGIVHHLDCPADRGRL